MGIRNKPLELTTMAVKIILALVLTLQIISQLSASPIGIKVGTVGGNVHNTECHGFQACIGDKLTKVGTVSGNVHATEYHNTSPRAQATATATATAGKRSRRDASPIDLNVKTVGGNIYNKECHGNQACIGEKNYIVDTIKGNLHATEHHNASPGVTATGTASAGKRRRRDASPINLDVKTVHGDIYNKECHGNQACIAEKKYQVDTINGNLQATEHHKASPEVKVTATASAGKRRRRNASPISLDVGTVHGNIHNTECHGNQACIGERNYQVDTINGNLHATEHHNPSPGAKVTATATSGR